jgi:hypothetical protein
MGYLSTTKFLIPVCTPLKLTLRGRYQWPVNENEVYPETRTRNEIQHPELQVPSPGHRKQRGKKRWPGNENEDYAASEGDPSSVTILRWTSGHCNGNENEANGTRERASVKTDTGL